MIYSENLRECKKLGIKPVGGGDTIDLASNEIIAEALQSGLNREPLSNTQGRRLVGVMVELLGLTDESEVFSLAEILSSYNRRLQVERKAETARLAREMGANIITSKG